MTVQFDFETRQQAIEERKRRLANLARQQNQGPAQGTMVGRHYVAPSILEHLNRSIVPALLGQMEQQALAKEQSEFKTQDRRAALRHAASLPSGELPMVQGQDYPAMDGEAPIEGLKRNATPAEATRAKAAWAQEGTAIPSRREAMERLLVDLEVNEPVRQEQRVARKEDREDRQAEAAAARQSAEALRREQLAQAAELKREQLAQAAEAARQRSEDMRYSADQRRAAAAEATAARADLARLTASLKTPAQGKVLPQSALKELGELESNAGTIGRLKGEFKPEFAGLKGAAATIAGNNIPGVTTDAAEWWKNYRKEAELAERHALFGAALTPTEQKSWREADIAPTMAPEAIQRNLARRAELAQKMRDAAVQRQQAAGYNATDAFPIERRQGGASGSFDAPATGLPPGWSVKTR